MGKACGGGLGPTRETGKTTKLTAPGCDATDGLDVDVVVLRFSLLFLWAAAVVRSNMGLTVLSWAGGDEVASGVGDLS